MTRDEWRNYICCVLTVREELIASDPALVQDLVDHVLGAGGASTTLAQVTVRTPRDRVLDLGLGADTADALDAAVDAMAALADEPRSAAMVAADLDFHHALVEAARSPRLSRVHETVLVETSMCLHAMRGTYSDAASRLIEHRAIADAVRAGDPDRARVLLVDHMRDGLVRVREGGEAR